MSFTLKAPAKINLGLRILGKRDDGFHNIHSIFQTVDLFDELSIAIAVNTSLACDNPHVPTGPENLVLRAKTLIQEETGIDTGIAVMLKKRIPMGAGLGGGSADAAAALKGISDIMNTGLSEKRLMDCAAKLGSDIPFLMRGGTAVVSGRGESIVPVDWPFDFTYVIVFPGFGVSTAWAYGNVKSYPDDNGRYSSMTTKLQQGGLSEEEFFNALVNDFEDVVFGTHPELGRIRDSLLSSGARKAIMTGSGASMIGIFENREQAENCAQTMRENYSDVFTVNAIQ